MIVREVVTDAKTGEATERFVEMPDVVDAAQALALSAVLLASNERAERTRRLAACDWATKSDVPMSDERRAAWLTYRQALRDVPQQAGFPTAIVWPAEPA